MSSQKVHLAFPKGAYLRDYEPAYLPRIAEEIRQFSGGRFVLSDPKEADLIILLQSAEYKTRDYIRLLENDPLVRHHTARVYVIDYDDHPEGLLPGLFTSIEEPFFAPQRHASWPILFMNNPLVYDLDERELLQPAKRRLFSFVGFNSHPVREQIFRLYSGESKDHYVAETSKFYNHDDSDRSHFVNVCLGSKFCLCPRGYASYSNRICEVMAMGRAPVIIADHWIPFSFPENIPYYLQIAEKDVDQLPTLLAANLDRAEMLGWNARRLWEAHCSKERRVVAALERIQQLASHPGNERSFQDLRSFWHSKSFLMQCGWTRRQQFILKWRQRYERFMGKRGHRTA